MNSLPVFSRLCTRRTTGVVRSSTKYSLNIPEQSTIQARKPTILQQRLLTTSTSTQTDPSPIDLSSISSAPSAITTITTNTPEPQPQPPHSSTLPNSSPYLLTGIVTRANTMNHCVQITRQTQILDRSIHKHYTRPLRTRVHDPNPAGYLREGDVVEFGLWSPSEKAARSERQVEWVETIRLQELENSKSKAQRRRGGKKPERSGFRGPRFVVRRVVTPFGVPLEERMGRLAEEMEALEGVDGGDGGDGVVVGKVSGQKRQKRNK